MIGKPERPSPALCEGHLQAVGDAMYAIGGKWKLRIIIALTDEKRRFNELQRLIKGISARVLSNELKDLELNGFIKRNVYPGPPVIVEYEIDEYSYTLGEVLKALGSWGYKHREKIKEDSRKQHAAAS